MALKLKGEVFLTKGNNSERMNYVLEIQNAFGLFPRVDGPGVEKTCVKTRTQRRHARKVGSINFDLPADFGHGDIQGLTLWSKSNISYVQSGFYCKNLFSAF